MHKSATKCNETLGKWYKNKHGASKIIDTFETYHKATLNAIEGQQDIFYEEPDLSRGVEGVDYFIRYRACSGEESE
jgi:hypothetical protein